MNRAFVLACLTVTALVTLGGSELGQGRRRQREHHNDHRGTGHPTQHRLRKRCRDGRADYMIIDNVMDYGAVWPSTQSKEPGMDFVAVPDFSDPSKLVPQLFESIKVSDDGKTATYKLRKGVKSAYGNELTTKDIEWKIKRHFALGAVANSSWPSRISRARTA